MIFTAKQIADFLGGEVVGDNNAEVQTISKIEEGKKGTLSFLANPKYENYLYTTQSTIVLVNKSLNIHKELKCTLIKVDNAYKSFASLLELYQQSKPQKVGVDKMSSIDESVELGENLYVGIYTVICKNSKIGNNTKIYPQVYIGENVEIGENTLIYPGVKIYEACKIGSNCIIHAGSVIGADGFGFAPQVNDEHKKVPQIGNVVLEDFVEIGANTTIDRATIGSTIIHKGAKLDNLIQIAHNVEVGERTFIAAQTGVSGSTKIGKDCLVGGQVGFSGHITIADEVKIGAQSGIQSGVKNIGEIIQGTPAISLREFQKSSILFKKLPELRKEIFQLKNEIENLKKNTK
ncbi:MAG: UDP-3-O-(3-hydroxymyristoyl)glucosamine N-acyltransferase [Bacteroidales bacterium]|nr:UDP-3-O-(3-hydroxymyristoyl)glucosamine N-acyltransferase [Bacteroidales bacterium]MBN2757756.1 UDP-3-O-(3-hydroxymyristoyl)glucosamine N-acyltransferase [Bacteroidales bacterium]